MRCGCRLSALMARQIRRPEEDFGHSRSKEETNEGVRELVDKNEGGIRLVIRGSEPKGPVIALRRIIGWMAPKCFRRQSANIRAPYRLRLDESGCPADGHRVTRLLGPRRGLDLKTLEAQLDSRPPPVFSGRVRRHDRFGVSSMSTNSLLESMGPVRHRFP
jgi:hypothetical protein